MAPEIAGSEPSRAPLAAGRARRTVTGELATQTLAAVDLGSNSFHMVVARLAQDELSILDRLRERVALRSGLDPERRLTPEIQERAFACLERFGQRLAGMPEGSVRAVGTNTLREARNARAFLEEARKRLGHPIEIISGAEEARLIYLGVAHDLSDDAGRRLVVDIGGGSTECIVGERFETVRTDSLRMGCVTYSMRFFPTGAIDARSLQAARLAARVELEGLERAYRRLGWTSCVGSSGTINAVAEILRENGWGDGAITPKGLKRLRKTLVAAGHAERLALPGLAPDRVPVIAGGSAILSAVIDAFGIERMGASAGALREGLMYDLLGRFRHHDVRDRTIRAFCDRYGVDVDQAQRVEQTALELARQLDAWCGGDAARALSWAARLHEIGLSVSFSRHQKHGAYLVENADMPGFSREDQQLLAALIDGHRRKLDPARFRALAPEVQRTAGRQCMILRLAAVLHRSRSDEPLPPFAISAHKDGITLAFPAGWLDEHPLTRADVELEAGYLAQAGFALSVL